VRRDNAGVLKRVPRWLRGWKPLTRNSVRQEVTAIIFSLMNTAVGYVVMFVGGGLGAGGASLGQSDGGFGPDYPAGTLIANITGSMAVGAP
jgi:hypothetical protein